MILGAIVEAVFASVLEIGAAVFRRRARPAPGRSASEARGNIIAGAYRGWARGRGLVVDASLPDRFAGVIDGRPIAFATGLGGSAPASPELSVTTSEPLVAEPALVTATSVHEDAVGRALAPVFVVSGGLLRTIALIRTGVRLRFEVGTDPEIFDEVLLELDRALRAVARPAGAAYR
jgi:hypothetical protein